MVLQGIQVGHPAEKAVEPPWPVFEKLLKALHPLQVGGGSVPLDVNVSVQGGFEVFTGAHKAILEHFVPDQPGHGEG
ncbi:hypothetical protein DC3_23450 [Deinococcus cellulosilyticus NBRC 106333 = KACC 11606]|uniref:Uncharacterized protein n=1 Tax=Deinococcus cellulosilyticus (strain DSM 18568 / NBRC 106333 / KACC 11606 / 5516J-15) TaxID=1223518 RepID=A0A511N1E0_DEIC1|nr:hypothetical protein DC3_23450 [Deinococcus cellulosilyticus NBRC 106333 = KACC 11606]